MGHNLIRIPYFLRPNNPFNENVLIIRGPNHLPNLLVKSTYEDNCKKMFSFLDEDILQLHTKISLEVGKAMEWILRNMRVVACGDGLVCLICHHYPAERG